MLSKKNKTNRLIFFTFTCLFFLLTFKITYAQIPCNDQVTCPSGCSCHAGTDPLKSYCYSDSDNSLCEEYTTPAANPNLISFTPQITIPGSSFKKDTISNVTASTAFIGEYIKAIYNYLLAIVGLLAAIVLMISGIVWLTAAGNTERISQAKNWMMGSFTGLILALSSFLLLKLINPNLVNFQIQEIEIITAQENGCCVTTKSQDKAFETTPKDCYSTLVNSGEITAISDKDLESKYENNLSKYLSGKFFAGYIVDGDKCVQLTEEKKAINKEECFGKGLSDSWGIISDSGNYWCFNEIAYNTAGEKREPCGDDYGSQCIENERCVNVDKVNFGNSFGGNLRRCVGASETFGISTGSLVCCESGAINTQPNSVCEGIKNGDKCTKTDDCWCFNGVPYMGDGGLGEPCGKKPGAVCDYDPDGIRCPDGKDHDNTSGTRSCVAWCCYKP